MASTTNITSWSRSVDGVIAHEGSWLGAETFVSFDRRAVKLLAAQGKSTRLLS